MSSDYDIEMRLNDVLELDTIIKQWNPPTYQIDVTPDSNVGSDSYNIDGFQTKTGVFDPKEPGGYTININGQQLYICKRYKISS